MGMLGIVSGIILNIADCEDAVMGFFLRCFAYFPLLLRCFPLFTGRSKYHVLNLPDSKVQKLRAAEEASAKAAESYGDASGSLNYPLLSSEQA